MTRVPSSISPPLRATIAQLTRLSSPGQPPRANAFYTERPRGAPESARPRRDVVAVPARTHLPRARRPRPARGTPPRRPGPRRATGGVSYGVNDATFRARGARADPRPAYQLTTR